MRNHHIRNRIRTLLDRYIYSNLYQIGQKKFTRRNETLGSEPECKRGKPRSASRLTVASTMRLQTSVEVAKTVSLWESASLEHR
ncbi:hypothetical protein Mapa_009957 [Marchantia paleacea]|nr:hypothetical protein Mapa_009957 [Marchantia paleacea]